MEKRTKKIALSMSILVILLGFFIYYIVNHISEFTALKISNPYLLIPIFIIFLIFSFTNGLITKFLLEPFDIQTKMKEWFGLAIVTAFYNTITPLRGGAITRAVYLKKKHNFSYSNFIATLSGVYVITIFAASILGLISLYFIYQFYNIFNPLVLLIFIAFAVPTLLIMIIAPRINNSKNRYINQLINIINGWHTIKKQKKIILSVSIIAIVQLSLAALNSILIYQIFGIEISFTSALFLACIGSLGGLINITPAGLGIQEAVAVFSSLVIGITPAQSLSAAIVGRAVQTIILLILGPIFSYILIKKVREE